jgi:phosphoglycolate phosphatase
MFFCSSEAERKQDMTSGYRLVVFDWDGTLMDSVATIIESIKAASRDLELPEPSDEKARHVIGLGLEDALRYAVPELSAERYPELADRYRHHYLSRDNQLTLFPGVSDLLNGLSEQGVLLAVATGKSRTGLDRALRLSGLEHCFQATRCADQCHPKPHPQMLLELMAEFELPPEAALMVGDTTHDLSMAANAQVDALGVSYGAHTTSALEALAPVFVVDSVGELSRWLRGLR